jgi:hypothetical protein
MNIEPTPDSNPEQWIVDENIGVDYNPIPIDDDTWAITGNIPVDGDVLIEEFSSRDDAEAALARIASAQELARQGLEALRPSIPDEPAP